MSYSQLKITDGEYVELGKVRRKSSRSALGIFAVESSGSLHLPESLDDYINSAKKKIENDELAASSVFCIGLVLY
jgi:choline kinase